MSNQTVGAVYQQIIQDVIDSSRVDFEEGGVEESVLEELRKGWQLKLSSMKVATFPWDPKPEPAPTPATTAAAPAPQPAPASAPAYTQAQLSPPPNAHQLSLPAVQPSAIRSAAPGHGRPEQPVKDEPVIKQEPGLQNGSLPPPVPSYAVPGGQNPAGLHNVAAQRAISQIASQFGQKGAASISRLHGHGRPPHAPPGQGQPQQPIPGQQYPQNMNPQVPQQRPPHPGQPNGQNGLAQSQMDGAADTFEGVLMRHGKDGRDTELGRVEIDRMLHEQIAAKAKRMEGGGLMVPLKQAAKHSSSRTKASTGVSQFDGIDDDIKEEDFDDEAINSDLDDPEDDQDDDDDDDDSMGHIMLCMYDKVQRVKNKWKCTLKDGVLTVNGKEYVFHKATGEYEW
ncbi:Transcription initiation factor IIA large subunit [Pleurostoma richardsiae]|uniref:Transcription initiation factor IIA large subunit n=1 Tax=Pleurostoma richardsiae TaxID=41990 RepID=A0AA38R3M5_9PEZI|nr:Transcription initiation factor IIA large subunit [Pleurostoma richardsiae]